ncbi:MAG TPA: DUF4058 family protein [Gemmataceae bacterium]|nr:DUF4058 family protein [Gemmataceae bacterium]
MPSPFPGMNPYLEHEDAWHNFHAQFPAHVIEQLNPLVGPQYYLKTDENVYIHELPEGTRSLLGRPDVFVGQEAPNARRGQTSGVSATVAAECLQLPHVDVERLPYIEIRDRQGRLVTIIELLSPSNKKPGGDRLLYESKRATVLAGPVNFVEIDLLRGYRRMPPADGAKGDYGVLVSRAQDRPTAEWYAIRLRDRLPVIPVPLDEGDPPATLDLQAVLNNLYDAGGFEKFLYRSPPQPPLAPEDATWAESLIPPGRHR